MSDQPPLLLLHGFLGSAQDWAHLVPKLSEFVVLHPDLPGHGNCPESTCTFEAQAEYLLNELQAHGYQSAHILGYSMGGRLALYLAVHHPNRVRSLLLESCSAGISDSIERQARKNWDQAWAKRFETDALNKVIRDWYDQALFDSLRAWPGFETVLARRISENTGPALAQALREGGAGQMFPLWDALAQLNLPIGCLSGELDTKYQQQMAQMQALQPKLQWQRLPGGHNLHLENPDAWLKAVQHFYRPLITSKG